jgi:hypothetical protein
MKYDNPTFGDFMEAAGFDGKGAVSKVYDYFRKRQQGKAEKDEIKESLSREEWIALLGLNSHVNPLFVWCWRPFWESRSQVVRA